METDGHHLPEGAPDPRVPLDRLPPEMMHGYDITRVPMALAPGMEGMPGHPDAMMPPRGFAHMRHMAMARPTHSEDLNVEAMSGRKRSAKLDDMDGMMGDEDEEEQSMSSKKPRTLMGGTFLLKTEAFLLTFSKDLGAPGYYKLVDGCPQVVPPEQLPADLDPLSLRLTDFCRLNGATFEPTTVGDLFKCMKVALTENNTGGNTLFATKADPDFVPVCMKVKCEERVGWVSYDQETTRFKMYVEQDGMLRDTTPQQFELDAGNHSRKWKSSFRLLGAFRVSQKNTGGVINAACVDLFHFCYALLNIETAAARAAKAKMDSRQMGLSPLDRMAPQRPPTGGFPKGSKRPGMPGMAGMPYVMYAGNGSSMPGSPRGGRGSPPSRPGSADHMGMPEALFISGNPSGGGAGFTTFIPPAGNSSQMQYLAIPMPGGAGQSAGPLSDAEVQAIQMIVTSSEGVKLAYAVQGIMQHVLTHYGKKQSSGGAAPAQGMGAAAQAGPMGTAQPAASAQTAPTQSQQGQHMAQMQQQPTDSQ